MFTEEFIDNIIFEHIGLYMSDEIYLYRYYNVCIYYYKDCNRIVLYYSHLFNQLEELKFIYSTLSMFPDTVKIEVVSDKSYNEFLYRENIDKLRSTFMMHNYKSKMFYDFETNSSIDNSKILHFVDDRCFIIEEYNYTTMRKFTNLRTLSLSRCSNIKSLTEKNPNLKLVEISHLRTIYDENSCLLMLNTDKRTKKENMNLLIHLYTVDKYSKFPDNHKVLIRDMYDNIYIITTSILMAPIRITNCNKLLYTEFVLTDHPNYIDKTSIRSTITIANCKKIKYIFIRYDYLSTCDDRVIIVLKNLPSLEAVVMNRNVNNISVDLTNQSKTPKIYVNNVRIQSLVINT